MIRKISPGELSAMREREQRPDLLDLRPVYEFIEGSIEGAMNLPGAEADFLSHLKKIWLYPGQVVLIAPLQDIQDKVASVVREMGGDTVGYVPFRDWARENRPVRRIQSISLDEVMERRRQLVLVDVRTPEEWERRHIPGSVNWPLSQLRTASAVLDKNTEVVVFCAGEYRGLAGAAKLRDLGYSVNYLTGGVSAWHEHSLGTSGA